MKIGIGLPATIPGATGDGILEWARRAEAAGFSSVGIIDRLIFANYEPLVTLAAVAGATPVQPGGPEVLVAGHVPGSFERAARFGDGWIYGRSDPAEFGELGRAVDAAWAATGRAGSPRKVSQGYYALGPNARENADRY